MKPLREEGDSLDPSLAAAAQLLAQVGPLAHSRLTQRRVRHQLETRYNQQGLGVTRRLKPAVVLGVLCGLAATAGATWGVLRATTPNDRENSVLEAPVVPPAVPAPARPAPPKPIATDSRATETRDPPSHTPKRPVATKPDPPKSQPSRAASASEAALVHRAVKELRSGGDPERARRLLSRYRAANPAGELAEEALVLSIEAAVAQGDPDAKRLARQYLAEYPNGRFAAAARRALR